MKKETAASLGVLYQEENFFERLFNRDRKVQYLQALSQSQTWEILPQIAPLLLSEELRSHVIKQIHTFMAPLSCNERYRLALMLKKEFQGGYRNLKSHNPKMYEEWKQPLGLAAKIPLQSHSSVSVLGLLSFHPSGYIREDAVKGLLVAKFPSILPFLLMRVNDWVLDVRERSRRGVIDGLRYYSASDFIETLPYITRLQRTGRADHQPLIDAIFRLLLRPGNRIYLKEAKQGKDIRVRRFAYKRFLQQEDELFDTLRDALQDDDIAIQRYASRRISQISDPKLARIWLEKLLMVRSTAIKIEAAYRWVELFSPMEEPFYRLLLSQSHALRDIARFYIQKQNPTDFSAYYQRFLKEEELRVLIPAIRGFGETASNGASSVLLPLLQHESTRVQAAVVRAMGSLGREEQFFVPYLQNPAKNVAKAAYQCLKKMDTESDFGERLLQADHHHTQRYAIYLMAEREDWKSIFTLIKALSLLESVLFEQALRRLRSMIRRRRDYPYKPAKEALKTFVTVVESHKSSLADLLPAINSTLSHWEHPVISG